MKTKQVLAVVVISLFIGVAIAPSIHANISKENELVKITIEVCGLPERKPYTVQLTKVEAKEIDRLFENIRERLGRVDTREETVEIFNEAIVELDKYGLLGGLSAERAQNLVTNGYQSSRHNKLIERIFSQNQVVFDNDSNYLCLLAGETDNTFFGVYKEYSIALISVLLIILFYNYDTFVQLLDLIYIFFLNYRLERVLHLRTSIALGGYVSWHPPMEEPAHGWLFTQGLNGQKSWNGSFRGDFFDFWLYYPGVTGFKGIRIDRNNGYNNYYYLGYAHRVRITNWN
jgi:hypothetical protein